jgi:hypothetical protein
VLPRLDGPLHAHTDLGSTGYVNRLGFGANHRQQRRLPSGKQRLP